MTSTLIFRQLIVDLFRNSEALISDTHIERGINHLVLVLTTLMAAKLNVIPLQKVAGQDLNLQLHVHVNAAICLQT